MKTEKIENKIIHNENGNALLWTMMAMALYFVIISSVTVVLISEIRQSGKINSSTQAYMAAETAEDRVLNYMNQTDQTWTNSGVKSGFIDNAGTVRYEFQVVKVLSTDSAKPYGNPSKNCEPDSSVTKYCYYALGQSGDVARRRDGEVKSNPSNWGKGHLQGLPETLSLSGTMGLLNIALAPSDNPPSSPEKFTLNFRVGSNDLVDPLVNHIPPNADCTNCFTIGLQDPTIPDAIGVELKRSLDDSKIVVDFSGDWHPVPPGTINSIEVNPIDTFLDFEVIYRKGGEVTLKVTDQNGKCAGVLVRSDLSNTLSNPTNMVFYINQSGMAPAIDPGNFWVNMTGYNKTIEIKNIFFKEE